MPAATEHRVHAGPDQAGRVHVHTFTRFAHGRSASPIHNLGEACGAQTLGGGRGRGVHGLAARSARLSVVVSHTAAVRAAHHARRGPGLQTGAERAHVLPGQTLRPPVCVAHKLRAVHAEVVPFALETLGVVGVVVEAVHIPAVGGRVGPGQRACARHCSCSAGH